MVGRLGFFFILRRKPHEEPAAAGRARTLTTIGSSLFGDLRNHQPNLAEWLGKSRDKFSTICACILGFICTFGGAAGCRRYGVAWSNSNNFCPCPHGTGGRRPCTGLP